MSTTLRLELNIAGDENGGTLNWRWASLECLIYVSWFGTYLRLPQNSLVFRKMCWPLKRLHLGRHVVRCRRTIKIKEEGTFSRGAYSMKKIRSLGYLGGSLKVSHWR